MGRSPGPTWSSVGTIVWLSSELMFFAGLFAMYFTIRSVSPDLWNEKTANLNVPYATVNTLVLVISSVWCQLGVFKAEHGQPRAHRLAAAGQQVGHARVVRPDLHLRRDLRVRPDPRVRHLVQEGTTIASDAYGSVFYLTTGFHGLHVTGGLLAFLLIIGRTFTTRRYTPLAGDRRHRHLLLLALRRRGLDRPVRHDLPAEVTRP